MRNFLIFMFLFSQTMYAQHTLQGYWQGKLKIQQDSLRLVFHFKDSNIFIISPDQGSPPIESEFTWNADTLVVKNKNLMAKFDGVFDTKDSTIKGYWMQGGGKRKLIFSKIDKIGPKDRPQNPKKSNYQAEEVKYKNQQSGFQLAGTLTIPIGQSPFPAVLLVTGSGPQDRNESLAGHYPFWVLADYLTTHGIAVLRYDDRGVAESEGKFDQATIYEFYSDAQAGIEYLHSRKEINSAKIGVIGHSEGGWIAEMLATNEQTKKIAFGIGLAGPGISGDSIMRLQGALVLKSLGIPDSTIQKYKKNQYQLLDLAVAPIDSADAINKAGMLLSNFLTQLNPQEQVKLGMTEQGIMVYAETLLSTWFRAFLRFKPDVYLQKIQVPYLALNGKEDIQVPAKENLQAIKKLSPKGLVTVKSYKGLNHLFQTCKTCTIGEYALLDETISVQVMDDIVKWITTICKK